MEKQVSSELERLMEGRQIYQHKGGEAPLPLCTGEDKFCLEMCIRDRLYCARRCIAMKTKDELPACPVATAVSLIGGKWKLLILRNLKARPWRFNELQRDLDGISQKVLTDSLRQMIDDGLAYRRDYQTMPPRVEYCLLYTSRCV